MGGAATKAALVTAAIVRVCFGASGPAAAPGLAPPPGFRITLERFVAPPTGAVGLLVKARINGGPQLRLLLDSGSQYVVLSRKAAARSGCAGGTDLDLVGPGGGPPMAVKQLQADTLQVGDLTLRGVPLVITSRPIADGVQGVVPLSLFAGFLVRLDIPGKELDLLPYPASQSAAGAIPTLSSHQLLFVKGIVNDAQEGYFLLDTGAAYTAISRNMTHRLRISETLSSRVPLQGGTESMDAPLLNGDVRLRLGSNELVTGPVVSVDLSTSSRYHHLETSGLIGYQALSDSVLTVNYRDGFIRIEPRANPAATRDLAKAAVIR